MAINQCGLQAAEANRAVLRYLAEDPDCWGLTPATGKPREMRIVSSGLTATKETVTSNELRADRMVSDVVEVAASSGGEINVEFSAGSLDDFFQAFLLGQWTRPMGFDKFEGTQVSIVNGTTTEIVIAGGDFRKYFAVGNYVKTEGFVNPANNDYWEIASLSFGSGNTTIAAVADTGVTEAGNAFGKVFDANDVIVAKSTAIRAGTASALAFDSNGGNAFATAITAGDLVVGQTIHVSGLGYETGSFAILGTKESGSFVFDTGSAADVGDAVSVNDGVSGVITFTFAAAAAGLTTVAHGADAAASAANLAAAINNHPSLNVTADGVSVPETCSIVNDNYTGGTLAEVLDTDDSITTTNFSGGVATVQDGDTVTIHDGVRQAVFEFDSDSAFTRGRVGVDIGFTPALTAANLQAAIMDQLRKKKITCSASVSSFTVTVRNLEKDQVVNASLTALSDDTAAVTTVDFTGATNTHGFWTITSLTNDVIGVAEPVATNANGSSRPVTIKGSHLRNPGDLADIQAQSFSIETGFTDKDQYFKMTGLRVGGFTLSLSAGEIVTGALTMMGKETTTSLTSILGNSPYEPLSSTATPVFNATTNVGEIYKNGELLASALQAIEIVGEAALREQRAVGSKFPAGIGTGRFNLTGTITSYFETLEMYEHFLNHDTISLKFDMADNDRNAYWFTIPALKVTTDPIAPGGIDQDVQEELEFVALRDPNLSTQFMIDRFSSTLGATS